MKNIETSLDQFNYDKIPNYIFKLNNTALSNTAKLFFLTAYDYGLYHDSLSNENYFTLSFCKEKLGLSKPTAIKYRNELCKKGFIKLYKSDSNFETIIKIDNECITNIKKCLEQQKTETPKINKVMTIQNIPETINENPNFDNDTEIILEALENISGYINDTESSFYKNRNNFMNNHLPENIKTLQTDNHRIIIPVAWLIQYLEKKENYNHIQKINFLKKFNQNIDINDNQKKFITNIYECDLEIYQNKNRLAIYTDNGVYNYADISKQQIETDIENEKIEQAYLEKQNKSFIEQTEYQLNYMLKQENINPYSFNQKIKTLESYSVSTDKINSFKNRYEEYKKSKLEKPVETKPIEPETEKPELTNDNELNNLLDQF